MHQRLLHYIKSVAVDATKGKKDNANPIEALVDIHSNGDQRISWGDSNSTTLEEIPAIVCEYTCGSGSETWWIVYQIGQVVNDIEKLPCHGGGLSMVAGRQMYKQEWVTILERIKTLTATQ